MLYTILNWILKLIDLYSLILFVYVLMSWIPGKTGWVLKLDDILGRICEPFLRLFRKIIPPIGGMIDVSPIVAVLVLQLVTRLIVIIF